MKFMDEHPDAGATGVRMINGKGKLLPESKRALPDLKTAFFKISGLSFIFPKSGLFNKYYLGNLDSLKTTQADIIAGAFMFLRREAVLKTGPLDENFFMYGEDIDYSYRLMKAGFKNYYYPEIKIIHYKGESTKKENLNVLVNFYNAMIIFVRKHFNNSNLKAMMLPIQIAIFFRAGLSLLLRFIKRIILPISDGIIIYLIFTMMSTLWGAHKFGSGFQYPDTFTGIIIPVYSLIMLVAITMFSGYKIPSKTLNALKGTLSGTIFILIVYALLPMNLRFSRAIIIFGGLLSMVAIPLWRLIISLIFPLIADNPFEKTKKTVIVSDAEGYKRVTELMSSTGIRNRIAGRVSIDPQDLDEEVLGNIDQLREVLRVNRIREVIFTTGKLNASQIIDSMHLISKKNVSIKIASAGENYILGSGFVRSLEDVLPFRKPSFRIRSKSR
jgi:cellulose synthase/poly-beta-1,6-N-acetylglucosamine synthase-like glycosyltransferase